MYETTQAGSHATEAARAVAQRDLPSPYRATLPQEGGYVAKEGRDYVHGRNLLRPPRFARYEREATDPLYRPLRVYLADPIRADYEGPAIVLSVPYEQLKPGPSGKVLRVDDIDENGSRVAPPVDLDNPWILLHHGLRPSPADFQFHQQMAYAVCSDTIAAFTVALGRDPSWGFEAQDGTHDQLVIRPHFSEERNAYFDRRHGELRFGYFAANDLPGAGVLPGGQIYTCLSRDVVVHETAHALLDGMRASFTKPTNPDVLAFHEAFADLMAILQHFSHRDAVREAILHGNGRLGAKKTIFSVAEQFGKATGLDGALRTALLHGEDGGPTYRTVLEPHDLGSVLVSAVLAAMQGVFDRRAEPVRTLHALSTAREAGLHPATCDLLAELAAKTAAQFMALCVRAIDYCPPVDITFGEYLRALVTADYDLVEDDRLRFRQELIRSFGRRRIYPSDVPDLSEGALLWRGPSIGLPEVRGLGFAMLKLKGDPGQSPDAAEISREAGALADLVTDPRYRREFGLVAPDQNFGIPVIESVRILRRVGPDRQVRFGLVAEVLQSGHLDIDGTMQPVEGGSTVILGGRGETRFVIRKAVDNIDRARRANVFARSAEGAAQVRAMASGEAWASLHFNRRCCGPQ